MNQAVIKPLSSDWTGLNKNLVVSLFAVQRKTGDGGLSMWVQEPDSPIVAFPITDANIEHSINWQSPFENMGADQRFSTLSALLQTGALAPLSHLWDQLLKNAPDGAGKSMLQSFSDKTPSLKTLEGKSSVTKLNSMQVFNGLPPMKISMVAHFRAYKDAEIEVETPIDQLISWALPKKLAEDGMVSSAIKGDFDEGMYPSLIPTIIGMRYGQRSFSPLVIEAIPYPLTGPRDSNGRLLSAQLQLSIASLSAWDANNWKSSRTVKT